MIKLIILLSLISFNSYARLTIGTSILYTKISNPDYNYVSEYERLGELDNFNIGYSHEINNINIHLSTNRLFNKEISRNVITKNHLTFNSKVKTTYDSLQLGYIKNRIMPAIFIANTEVRERLYTLDRKIMLGEETKHTIIKGVNLVYFVNKNISANATYLLPDNELHLKGGLGFGMNYIF